MSKRSSTLPQPPAPYEHRLRPGSLLDDVQMAAAALSADLTAALDEWMGDLPSNFRPAMTRAFHRVLTLAKRQEKRVLVFDDALPGFLMILLKKEAQSATWERQGEEPAVASVRSPEAQAASALVDQFIQRTKNRVLVVESADGLFIFFPSADQEKNLRELQVSFDE